MHSSNTACPVRAPDVPGVHDTRTELSQMTLRMSRSVPAYLRRDVAAPAIWFAESKVRLGKSAWSVRCQVSHDTRRRGERRLEPRHLLYAIHHLTQFVLEHAELVEQLFEPIDKAVEFPGLRPATRLSLKGIIFHWFTPSMRKLTEPQNLQVSLGSASLRTRLEKGPSAEPVEVANERARAGTDGLTQLGFHRD